MLTLAEYLEDYSSAETKEEGYKLIEEELLLIKDSKKKEDLATKLLMIKNGKRDMLY
jgi:2-iminoacetate synthase